MLTACPKCHHLFVQQPQGSESPRLHQQGDNGSPCGGAVSLSSITGIGNQGIQSSCCPAVMTLHVPCTMTSWTGGSVILQKGDGRTSASSKSSTTATTITSTTRSPEPSPSIPLSFVLPTTPTVIMARPEEWSFAVATPQPVQMTSTPQPQSEVDLQRLSWTLKALKSSGWYYEGLSWQESVSALISTPPGTFLIRDSSDPRYLFSLSVQTERGPTSVRLHYSNGHFRLDAEPKLAPVMPVFDCVVKLVEHYVRVTKDSVDRKRKTGKSGKDQVLLIDSTGQMYSHILLTRPLSHKDRFPTLMHLARLTLNRHLRNGTNVPIAIGCLPVSLNNYLNDYPYTL